MPTANPGLAKNSDPSESRAIFVDEQSCIGCKNCMWCAPATFRIEDDFGRSRAYAQWADTEDDIDTAVLSCPVDCIHWVDKAELPALEHVSQRQQVHLTGLLFRCSLSRH
jgi:ferredoxin